MILSECAEDETEAARSLKERKGARGGSEDLHGKSCFIQL